MRRFLFQAALFLLACLLIGYAVEGIVYVRMMDKRAHVHEDWPDLKGLACDYWIVGDSRTTGHLIPSVVDSVTGMTGHNIAYSGYRMRMGLDRIRFAMEHAQESPFGSYSKRSLIPRRKPNSRQLPHERRGPAVFLFDQLGINKYYRRYENWRELDAWLPLLRYKGYPSSSPFYCLGWNRWDRERPRDIGG